MKDGDKKDLCLRGNVGLSNHESNVLDRESSKEQTQIGFFVRKARGLRILWPRILVAKSD